MMNILMTAFHVLVFPGLLFCVVLGILLAGINRKLVARMQNRVGPPLLQPWYDFLKCCGKETIIPRHAKRQIFLAAPVVGFAALITAALFGAVGLKGKSAAAEHCGRILEEMDMSRLADCPARELTLSGQKRLELARAVCTGAEIVMLDEVMAGLTPTEVADMSQVIVRLRQSRKLTVLIIEHVMKALMNLSGRIVVLHHGQVIATGKPEDIAKHPMVHEVYFGESL